MEINYIFGNNKTQKTTKIIEKAKQIQLKGEKALVIVPEQTSLSTEIALLKELNSMSDIQVYSFLWLSNKVFQESGVRNLVNLEETGKLMLLKLIVDKNEKLFKYYRKSAFKSGFISELSDFLSDFFKNDITLSELSDLINNESLSEVIRFKLHDVKIILEEYNNFLSEKYISSDDTLDLLASKVKESSYLKDINVLIDGFYGLTEQEYKVIDKLIPNIKSLTITFNINANKKITYFDNLNKFDPYYEPKKMCNKITDIISEHKLKVTNVDVIDEKLDTNYDLDFLKVNFLKYKNFDKFLEQPQNIELTVAKNKISEVTTVAKKICNYVISGYTYNDIKIICGDIDDYKSIVHGVFDQFEIPVFIDEKDDIMLNSLTTLITGFLDVFSYNYSFSNVMNLLKNDLFYDEKFSLLEIEIFENYMLEYGIKNYQFKNEFKMGSKNKKYDIKQINETRKRILECMNPFSEGLTTSKKYQIIDLAKRVILFLEYNDIAKKIEIIINKSDDENDLRRKKEYEQIWEKVILLLEKIVDILGQEEVTVKEFKEILVQGLESSSLGMIPLSQNEVTVGDYQRSRFPKSKVVFIVGAKDDSFPQRPKESSVITDQEKILLKSKNEKIITTNDLFLKQNLLMFDCIMIASEKLNISYPFYTLEGDLNTEANILKKVKELFPQTKTTSDNEVFLTNKKTMLPYVVTLIKKEKLNIKLTEKELEFLQSYKDDELYKNKVEIISEVVDGYAPNQLLSSSAIKSLYNNKMETSISKLEKYAKCPFSYFLEYNLRLKDRRMFEIMHVDIGVVFHAILDMFSKIIDSRNIDFASVTEEQVDEIVDEIINNMSDDEFLIIFNNSYRYSYYLERIKEISKKSIYALGQHLNYGMFKIFGTEFEFGKNAVSKIVINLDNEKIIELTGKIDRVDIYEDGDKRYVKIIDFKSSHKKYNEEEVILGTQLQLLTYLDILIKKGNQIFKGNQTYTYLPGGIYYFEIKNPVLNELVSSDYEEIKKELLREFKLEGVTNSDLEVINKVDKYIEEQKNSDVINVKLKKDGTPTKASSIYSEEQFENIRETVTNKIKEISKNIFDGKIDIDFSNAEKLNACDYCNFSAVCKRDNN